MGRKISRAVAQALSWILAGVGIATVVFGGLALSGITNYAIVESGSMEPEIRTGDLIIELKADTHTLDVGDVVSVPSPITKKLVTHRIVEFEQVSNSEFHLRLKGDANSAMDGETYVVSEKVWTPRLVIPGLGSALSLLMYPGTWIAFAFVLLSVLLLTYFFARKPSRSAISPGLSDEANANDPFVAP